MSLPSSTSIANDQLFRVLDCMFKFCHKINFDFILEFREVEMLSFPVGNSVWLGSQSHPRIEKAPFGFQISRCVVQLTTDIVPRW